MKIILLGPPGSGKGSHRVRVRERYPLLCYANANELLRNEVVAKTPFGVDAQMGLAAGRPVPDAAMLELVLRFLKAPACSLGFILEGLPRNAEQAEALSAAGHRVDALVELAVPDDAVVARTSGRLVHRASGRIYHDAFAPPLHVGKDDVTGETLTRRLDDTAAVARERLAAYRAGVKSVKRYFAGQDPYPDDSAADAAAAAAAASTTASSETQATTSQAAGGSARQWAFPARPPAVRTVDGEGSAEEVRGRLLSTLDELVGKRASGPHQNRFWWSWFS